MLWVPKKGILRCQHNTGAVSAAGPGSVVTTGASASTKGTVVELINSTSFDAYLITIVASAYAVAATDSRGCLDILVGAATEEVLIPNLLMGNSAYFNVAQQGPKSWTFPLYIPAGARIAARAAGARTSATLRVAVFLWGGDGCPPFRAGSKVTTYGIGTVPDGTAITPGASAAEGSWTQIAASTSEDHFAFMPSFQFGNDTTTNLRTYALDLGIGAATEEMIAEGYWYGATADETMFGPLPSFPCFADVPSGTRLAMRVSNNGTNDGAYQGAIHAVS